MTQRARVVSDPDRNLDQTYLWLDVRRLPARRPTPPTLVVARCAYVAVLITLLAGMPPLLRAVGTALG